MENDRHLQDMIYFLEETNKHILLCCPKIYNYHQTTPKFCTILRQSNPVITFMSYFSKVNYNNITLTSDLPTRIICSVMFLLHTDCAVSIERSGGLWIRDQKIAGLEG
jgi:hypothetical protein